MKLDTWTDVRDGLRHYHLTLTEQDIVGVELDPFDLAVLGAPKTGVADALQDLQLIAFRLEQQEAAKRASTTKEGRRTP